jgi:predicted dehydrogenase
MNIGIVGAENSHTAAIANVLNVERRVRGFKVTHVWGEKPKYARAAAEAGQIPNIVKEPQDLIGQVDAVALDHRHGKEHLPAAAPLLEAGLPLFVDKPFCYRTAQGRSFLTRAAELGVPVCSFSVLPHQKAFADVQKELRKLGQIQSLVTTGACDIKSKYGGIFFYGIHQVDMVLRLLGYDLGHAQVVRGAGRNHVATLSFGGGAVATMNLINGAPAKFHVSAIGENGRVDREIVFDDSQYLGGVKAFCKMFRTGKTVETVETMLGPVAVLEALEKSVARRARVKVSL